MDKKTMDPIKVCIKMDLFSEDNKRKIKEFFTARIIAEHALNSYYRNKNLFRGVGIRSSFNLEDFIDLNINIVDSKDDCDVILDVDNYFENINPDFVIL